MYISQISGHLLWCIFFCYFEFFALAENVNPYLKKYSSVNFDKKDLLKSHAIAKRSPDNYLSFKFEAHQKIFDIKIEPIESPIFQNDHVEIGSDRLDISDFQMYEGFLVDEPTTSHVSGTIIDGSFIGTIKSKKDGTYHIEPAKRYEETSNSNSIIYHETDVISNPRQKRSTNENSDGFDENLGCGLKNLNVKEALAKEQKKISEANRNKVIVPIKENLIAESETYKYSKEANLRNKRQSQTFPDGKTVCSLYLKIDPFLYDTIYNKEGNKNEVLTRSYLLYYLNQQVSSLNNKFKAISSSVSSYFQTLLFRIYRTKIYRFSDCNNSTSGLTTEEKRICENYLDAITFLNYVSLDNASDFCLSFAFTSRDFSDGTLGLAFLASTNGGSGGICEKQANVQGTLKSTNTGIVTMVNFGARVPEVVNQITFAHEVGHSLGSEHDPTNSNCSPGGTDGNFIMYSRATTGNQKNNVIFSSCSISQMNAVMAALLPSSKNCLKVPNESICGNGIIEAGEVCDTGNPDGGNCCIKCKSRVRECDPSEGPCCDPNTCTFYKDERVCLASNDCRQDIKCNDTSAQCPITQSIFFKPDLSLCNNDTQVCRNGTCTDSICDKFGMKQCYIEGNLNDTSVDKSALCLLSCQGSQTNNQCKQTKDISDFNGRSYSLRPGSACSAMQGYCDIFSKCRSVNAQGSLAKLAKTLIAPTTITIEDIKTWAIKYWWAILIFCIVFIAINGFLLFCFLRHIKSDNPEKSIELRFRDTIKNPFKMFERRSDVMKKDNLVRARRLRQEDKVKPVAREVRLKNDFGENRSGESSDFNLRTISSSKNIPKIRKNPRLIDEY
ncbi:unnamed protein product [Brachionus calyciflorus]|uniref:ADAM10 endopeptidase n=1 Tax=Brachionus calyciflorus TaxID=104777 RepID=A0A813XTX6_9BILA|nr:unnamed protein product [Brachionus calyciflorus]